MTDTPHDPQRSTDGEPSIVPAPGLISGATPPPAAPAGQPRVDAQGRVIAPPNGLAGALLGVAGAYLLLTLVGAASANADVDAVVSALETGSASPTVGMMVSLLSPFLLLCSYVAYAMWASRVRLNLEGTGRPVPGPKAVEWWGWFVPIASVVLVPWGAHAISRRATSLGNILGWWIAWTGAMITSAYGSLIVLRSVDQVAGEITNQALLDQLPMVTWTTAGLTVVSYVFMVLWVRQTTARHLAA